MRFMTSAEEQYYKEKTSLEEKIKSLYNTFKDDPNVTIEMDKIFGSLTTRNPRYAIKHIPSNKFYHEDEGGAYLVDEKEGFVSVGNRKFADQYLSDIEYIGIISTEEGDIPASEFEVVEV